MIPGTLYVVQSHYSDFECDCTTVLGIFETEELATEALIALALDIDTKRDAMEAEDRKFRKMLERSTDLDLDIARSRYLEFLEKCRATPTPARIDLDSVTVQPFDTGIIKTQSL